MPEATQPSGLAGTLASPAEVNLAAPDRNQGFADYARFAYNWALGEFRAGLDVGDG